MLPTDPFTNLFGQSEQMMQNAQAMTRMWMDMSSRMMSTGLSMAQQGQTPPEAGREMRGAAFKALSQFFEEYLRSPQFLDVTRQTMDGVLTVRKQFDQLLTQLLHDLQGVAQEDIDQLMKSIRHMETRLLDRLEIMDERLDELCDRLDQLDGSQAEDGESSRRRPTAEKPGAAAARKSRRKR